MPDGNDISERASKVLLRWITNPTVTRCLGRQGVQEVASQCDVELGRDCSWEATDLINSGSV